MPKASRENELERGSQEQVGTTQADMVREGIPDRGNTICKSSEMSMLTAACSPKWLETQLRGVGCGWADETAGLHEEGPLSVRLRTWSPSAGPQGAIEGFRTGECQDPMWFYIHITLERNLAT